MEEKIHDIQESYQPLITHVEEDSEEEKSEESGSPGLQKSRRSSIQ